MASTQLDIEGRNFVFIPAPPNERLHLYFVSVKIQLTFRDVIGESRSQSVDNALVKLQIR